MYPTGKKLKDSTISTRALYGNYKNRKGFPNLKNNPVRYSENNKVHCSICKKKMTYDETNQLWISLSIGTDITPLLINSCSKECEDKLPDSPKNYIQHAHKGGSELKQPDLDEFHSNTKISFNKTPQIENPEKEFGTDKIF